MFERVGKILFLYKKFSIFLIGLCPICFNCVYVGLLWHSNMYLGIFYKCSCIVYMLNVSVHTRCLIKCSLGIFALIWTPMGTKLWGLPCLLNCNMFLSLLMCFAHFSLWMLVHALVMHYTCTHPITIVMHIVMLFV